MPESGANGGGDDAGGPRMMYMVSSLEQLRMRVAAAQPGDTIVLADGTYSNPSAIVIDQKGTAAQPIVVAAQSIGGVTISGAAGLTFGSNAAYAEIRGFRFTHAAATNMPAGSHHCRLMRNVFNNSVAAGTRFVVVSGDDHEVGYNTFRDKSNEGMFLNISGPGGAAMAQRTWAHHNYFLNFSPCGANNCGAIQIGLSGKSLTDAHAILEYNLFVNTRGENEGSLTSKVSSCIYRYNTFGAGAEELSLRHGNNVQVYGNFFIGSIGGMRIFGHNHRIYSNYFENNAKAINVGNGDCTIPPGALTCHDKPVGVHITFNTLVNNQRNLFMTGRAGGLGAGNMVIANNIIQGGGMAGDFSGPMGGAMWEGNIISGIGAGGLQGQTTLDAKLVKEGGVFRLAADSPAIGKAVGNYPYAGEDMDRQPRAGQKAPGADEPSTTPSMNRPLTPEDVGPNAGL
jgi:poly(beta-D-mannuronate) lyase